MKMIAMMFVLANLGGSRASAGITLTYAELSRTERGLAVDSAYPNRPATYVIDDTNVYNLLSGQSINPLQGDSYSTPGTGEVSISIQNSFTAFATGTQGNITSFGGSFKTVGLLGFDGDESRLVDGSSQVSLRVEFLVDTVTHARVDLGWSASVSSLNGMPPGYAGAFSWISLFKFVDFPNFLIKGSSSLGLDGQFITGPTNGVVDLVLTPGMYAMDVSASGNGKIDPGGGYPAGGGSYRGGASYEAMRSFRLITVPEPSSIISIGIASVVGMIFHHCRRSRKSP